MHLLDHPLPGARAALCLALFLTACGEAGGTSAASGTSSSASSSSASSSSSSSSSSSGDAAPPVDRGPTSIPLDGDGNGLWWDAASATLYLADNHNNRILQWTDAGGIALVGELPKGPPNGAGLGQVVKTPDGTLVVTRFGYGTSGDVVFLAPDKSSGKVPGLDPIKRRIGLTVTADGTLFDTYFVQSASGDLGAVAKLDLGGTEVDFVSPLKKPIGVLASGSALIISDQHDDAVLVAPLASPGMISTLATIPGPDLLCAGPEGSYFMGGTTGEVRHIAADGSFSTLAGGFLEIRGVAYDPVNKRVFAAEHDPDGAKNTLRILPVD